MLIPTISGIDQQIFSCSLTQIMNVYMYKDSGSKTQDIRTHCITVLANISQFFHLLVCNLYRILHECSCFIEVIKQVGEKR